MRRTLFEPIGKPAPPRAIVACARCGEACQIREQPNARPEAVITLRAATTDRGTCRECATHWWLFSVDGLRWGLSEYGPGIVSHLPAQEALARVLGMMHPELAGCDWNKLQAQWDLPWPDDWKLPVDSLYG